VRFRFPIFIFQHLDTSNQADLGRRNSSRE
jgi:hypothetical protein